MRLLRGRTGMKYVINYELKEIKSFLCNLITFTISNIQTKYQLEFTNTIQMSFAGEENIISESIIIWQ